MPSPVRSSLQGHPSFLSRPDRVGSSAYSPLSRRGNPRPGQSARSPGTGTLGSLRKGRKPGLAELLSSADGLPGVLEKQALWA